MKQFNLEEYLNNPKRKIITGDGRNVRIICTDAKISTFHSIIALVRESNGNETIVTYTNEGRYYSRISSKTNDLFFAPEKHEGWVNIYKNLMSGGVYCDCNIYASNEDAKKQHGVAIAKIEWEE